MATTKTAANDQRHGHDVSGEARDEDGRFMKSAKPAPKRVSAAKSETASKSETSPKGEVAPKKPARRPASKKAAPAEAVPALTHPGFEASGGSSAASTGALIAAGAAGLAVGVAAMIGRKVAVQAPTALAGNWDAALAAEHTAVIKLFDAMAMTTTANIGKRTLLLAQLKHALTKHAMQEENVIYPALREAGEVEAADALNHDHGYVKQYLYELENCPKDSEAFMTIVAKFRADLEKHVHEEEDKLFPALKSQLSEATNKAVTLAMNKEGFKVA